ncbi:WXG100 family type VII secretion target [Nocardiopsis potens]|uniref:WXG100 family type VII secretion target n=1 Tax=Nocardiopsis potens TaxID=1246458 RepID=UPI00035C4C6E|nr:WXG100 family type VII secretion target [Nocardiopsis potens]
MSAFSAKYGGMDTAGLDLNQATNDVARAIEDLDDKVRSIKNEWVGDAADQYEVAIANWRKNVDDMRVLLASAQVSLDDITERYKRGDLGEASVWSGKK